MSLFSRLFSHHDGPRGYRDVEPALVPGRPPGARVIDVREPAEFTGELGRIPGAELVPLATLASAAAAWPREDELIVVCRSGGRSAKAAAQLSGMGFQRVMNMTGGMLAYNQAGLPR